MMSIATYRKGERSIIQAVEEGGKKPLTSHSHTAGKKNYKDNEFLETKYNIGVQES